MKQSSWRAAVTRRIERPQCASRRIPRIRESSKSRLLPLLVQPFERAALHHHLAANLERSIQCRPAFLIRSGRDRIVRAFPVTSSPVRPSPRVTAC